MNKVKKNKSRKVQKQAPRSFNVLVVADAGDNADYKSEPRYEFTVSLDFMPTGRSSVRQLEGLIRQFGWLLPYEVMQNGFHAWLLDESGIPCLSLTGLLGVRKGEMTKGEVEMFSDRLIPQVICEQQEYKCNLLVSASACVTSYDYDQGEYESLDEDQREDYEVELENELLDGAFGCFHYCEPSDSSFDDCVYVAAVIWEKVEITLPFDLLTNMSRSQHWYVRSQVAQNIIENIDSDFEPEMIDVELWLTDSVGQPSQYLNGLLHVLEGRLTKRKLKQVAERARQRIPYAMLASEQAA